MNAHESNGNYIINFIKSNPYNPKAAQKLARHLDMLKADQQIFLRDTYNQNFSYYTREQLERALKTACEHYQGIDWPSVEDIKRVLQRPQFVRAKPHSYSHITDELYLCAINAIRVAKAKGIGLLNDIARDSGKSFFDLYRMGFNKLLHLDDEILIRYQEWLSIQKELHEDIIPVIKHFENRSVVSIWHAYMC